VPHVGNKKFAYTKEGKAEAKAYAKKEGIPVYKAAMGRAQFATTTSKPSMFVNKLQPYNGSYLKGNLAGHEVSNKNLTSYYKGMIDD